MKLKIKNSGMTLIELMVAIAIAAIGILAASGAMADSFKSWGVMYNKVNSDVVVQGYTVTNSFEKVVRQSTLSIIGMDTNTNPAWVEVFYAKSATPTVLDQHAKFSYDSSKDELLLERGTIGATTPQIICENVTSCVFKRADASIQMIMTITSGNQTVKVISSALLHNSI